MAVRIKRYLAFLIAAFQVIACCALTSQDVKAEDVLPTIVYNESETASLKRIGTFSETTMAGYTGDVYLASLPYGAEITSIDCPLSFRDETTDLGHNYFGSGSMCLMYDDDALVTIQDELIYDDQFTDADFIAEHTFGYDGYGDLYSWISFTEDLPTEDVKGFAVYDADFGTWAGEGGTIVFIQIATKEAQPSYSLDAGGVTITYSAAKEGSSQQIGTFSETTMAGYTGDVYLASLPYGTEITAIECPRSYIDETTDLTHNYFGSGTSCLMYDSDALVTIQDQLIYDGQFTDATFIVEHTFGYDGYGDLYGWITFDESLPTKDVKGFAVYDADFGTWAGDGGTIIFIQISTAGGTTPSIDKTALASAIESVTGENAKEFYQSGDRYNGKATDTITDKNSGFWMELTAEGGALETAQSVNSNDRATQSQVDTATEVLSAAIGKLIPKTQLNATALYEVVQTENGRNLNESDYTALSWKAYPDAKADAEAYLASLFTTDAQGNIVATDENKAENQAKADAKADALAAAYEGLYSQSLYELTQSEIPVMKSEAAILFQKINKDELHQEDYSDESWAAFESAYAAAEETYEKDDTFTGASSERSDLADCRKVFSDLYVAWLLLEQTGNIQVSLTVNDLFGVDYPECLLTDPATATFSGSKTLPAGQHSIWDLCSTLDWSGKTSHLLKYNEFDTTISQTYLIYINGVLVRNPFTGRLPESLNGGYIDALGTAQPVHEKIQLHDGDHVIILRVTQPNQMYYAQLEPVQDINLVIQNFNLLQFTTDSVSPSPKEGESFALNLTEQNAYWSTYDGRLKAAVGKEIIAYGPMNNDGTYPAEPIRTGSVTDGEGKAIVTLNQAGTYVLIAMDTRGMDFENKVYPGLAGGAHITVTIAPMSAEELSAVKSEFCEKLDVLLEDSNENDYEAEAWAALQTIISDGKSAIQSADSMQSVQDAYDQAVSDFRAVTQIDHASILARFAHYLKYLPSIEQIEEGCFTQMDKERMGWLTELHDSMSDYQRGMLSSAQQSQYNALIAAYGEDGSGLPEFNAFNVTVSVDDSNLIYDDEFSQFRAVFYDREENRNTILTSWVSFNRAQLESGYIPSIEVESGGHKPDAIELIINISKDYYDQLEGIEVEGAEADSYSIEDVPSGFYRYTYYILTPYHDFNIHIKSVQDPLQKAKNAALSVLETALNSYNKSDYTTDKWEELTAAYSAGVVAINAATSESAVTEAKQTALDSMAAVQKKTADNLGTVTVIVENTTYTGADFTGTVITADVALTDQSSMMKSVLTALHDEGYSWTGTGGTGYGITYLSSIYIDANGNGKPDDDEESLAEFDGGPQSGWMGTLNDWFVNEGFNMFTVANGKLKDGDVIRVQYTKKGYGTDLGATWANNDTSLKELTVDGGSFGPEFDSGETEYVLTPTGNSVSVVPTATNKNFQVRIFLNKQTTDANADYYRSGESIPVKSGDVIWIGVGESAWPSMNEGTITGTWYKLTVVSSSDSNAVMKLINEIGSVTYENCKSKESAISQARAAYDALTDEAKADVTNYAVLEAAEAALASFEIIDTMKAEIAALPSTVTEADRDAVETAKAHYDALTAAQQNLLTVAETNKLLKAVNTMAVLDALAAIDDAKDFASTEANTQAAVKAALEAWLNNADAAVAVDSFTAAEDGTAENLNGVDGSYSATVTVTIGSGAAAASGEKTVTGRIIPVVYAKSSDAGIQSIKVNGVTATGSGTAYSATLPYGSDMATATFEIVPADKATFSAPATTDGGETWTFTVTAEDGTTQQTYTVTLSVNSVVVTVHECGVYTVTSDVTVTELSPAAVSGLLEAVSTDALELPQGTETVALWLSVTATAKDGEDTTLRIEPIYAVDGAEGQAVPAAALIGQITVTLPIPGTEYSKVLAAGDYLDAEGTESGITFMITAAGEYTLIPDAHIADVTWHLNGGTSADVTDGQQTIYFRSDAGSDLPEAEKSGYAFKGWHIENSIDSVAYIAVSAQLPADLYAVWQSQNVNAAVTVSGVSALKSGSVFTVTLPYGSAYPKAADISITPEDAAATYTKPMTGDDGASWSFTVTAEDGTRQEYTLQVVIAEQTAEDILTAAKQAIEGADWNTEQTTANSEETLKTFVEGKLAALDLGAAYTVNVTSVTPAVAGNAENTQGTAGSYSFTVTLTSGEDSATATGSGSISATAYVAPAQAADYVPALNAVLPYLRDEVTDPDVGSTYGEWAVFALNRGGAATEVWNNIYLSNLKTYVDECGGKLAEKNYTEYSRVILALTSMGVDASSFSTDKATYDLVKPLLDKQDNGDYWAEWQGNNGTCFALLAVDSHGYLNTAEGKALRAGLIASLKAHQQASGAWAIEGYGTPDLDVTAAAVYALAPYYLDEAKLTALGGTVTYAELKTMVENALAYLSNAQNSSGGFGSVEADVWAIIALSSIGRDADTDPAFVKNGKSLLADMLSYQDETTGAFRHLLSGSVDQMATEQAAYGLVAYDRFKNGKNTLYDMSDVSFDSGEQSQAEKDKALAESVDALIDAIGEVTLESENAIAAARTAYDALTDAQKALVTKLSVLTAAEAKLQELKNESGSGTGNTGTDESDKKTIRVTMRLIGAELASKDVDLGETPAYLPNYVTWIPTTEYELDEGATVYDLWILATEEAGIRSVGAEKNYVSTVYAPSGYALSEFTNGRRSGWMYTIDGRHPGYGLKEQALHDGDEVIWHYINDYSYECADWFSEGQWQALGDGTYYDQWLKAPDTYLGAGGGIGDSGSGSGGSGSGSESGSGSGSGGDTTVNEPKNEAVVDVTAEVTDGEAKATVETEAVTEALENTENADVLTVKVESEEAESVELTLDAGAVKAAAEAEADLHIETEQGTVKLVSDAMSELAEAGGEVAVSVTANEDGSVTLDVTVDGESADVTMKVELPAADEGQVLVIVNEDGTEEIIKKSVVEGDTVYAEIPAGATVKVIENSKEFNDVADNAWYAGAVDFASSHDLFRGVSEDEFAPQSPMTRAMLATVLFRLEDEPEGAVGVNFGDVKDDTWYADAVAWASDNGIVNGTGNGFEPNANISREQIATMLYRYVNYLGIDTGARGDVSKFKDGKEVSSWASDAMAWAVEVGLFKGDETGSLNPKADATRAEVATLMERLIGLLVK